MKYGLLREIEDFRNIQRYLGRALYTSLDFLTQISGINRVRKERDIP